MHKLILIASLLFLPSLASARPWTSQERERELDACLDKAVPSDNSLTPDQKAWATRTCQCVMGEIEKIYPNYEDFLVMDRRYRENRQTKADEDLSDRLINICLERTRPR